MDVNGVRSSCDTVDTKSDFICSTRRSAEMSRNAKMRPATAPTGSRITASLTDSHTSSLPRMIGTSRSAGAVAGGAVGTGERHAEVRRVPSDEHRIELAQSWVAPGVLEGHRRARLHDVAGQPRARGAARTDSRLCAEAARCADDELAVGQHADGARVGLQELVRLLDDLVEHDVRIELGREPPARARELLGESARAALRFVQLAPFECPARGAGQMLREL